MKTDEKRGKRCLRSQTLFLWFSKITGSESVFPLTWVSTYSRPKKRTRLHPKQYDPFPTFDPDLWIVSNFGSTILLLQGLHCQNLRRFRGKKKVSYPNYWDWKCEGFFSCLKPTWASTRDYPLWLVLNGCDAFEFSLFIRCCPRCIIYILLTIYKKQITENGSK